MEISLTDIDAQHVNFCRDKIQFGGNMKINTKILNYRIYMLFFDSLLIGNNKINIKIFKNSNVYFTRITLMSANFDQIQTNLNMTITVNFSFYYNLINLNIES